jgi:voltage-gated potassium channel
MPAEQSVRAQVAWGGLLEALAMIVALVVVYYALPLAGRWWYVGVAFGAATLIGVVPLTVRQARRILVSPRPLLDTARAIAVLLTVIILGFAGTYYGLDAHSPGEMHGMETKTDAVYFSVVVLATVGFGDIVPTGQVARVVTTVNILCNLASVAIAVKVVTWAGRQRVAAIRDQGKTR